MLRCGADNCSQLVWFEKTARQASNITSFVFAREYPRDERLQESLRRADLPILLTGDGNADFRSATGVPRASA